MNSPSRITLCVHYCGRVQGVGFRYTVREIVKQHPVDGYVKNLADGQVELVAQGTISQIESLLAAIAERFHGNITGINRQEIEGAEVVSGFDIRH